MDLSEKYIQENATILLKGIWYSELPPIIDFEQFDLCILDALNDINNKHTKDYRFKNDFIENFSNVSSPQYIRKPGVEGITFYDFKHNKTLREMQIPNLKHYIAFIYNTLLVYNDIFTELYLNDDNKHIVENSNSYLMFEKTFEIRTDYDDSIEEIEAGIFAEKNNKITGSAMIKRNRKRYHNKQNVYLYKMKMDLESFFPNLYTHYFHRIFYKEPLLSLDFPEEYFEFLDIFHQRINDNQTKGIPAGVFSSHVAAELCMLCIDYQINNLISGKNVAYIRYVDDFTFFANSKELLEDLKTKVQQILNDYRLRINGNKTEITDCIFDYPKVDTEELKIMFPWLYDYKVTIFTDEKLVQIKKYISKLIKERNNAQIKTLLTLFANKISHSQFYFGTTEEEYFSFFVQLSQSNTMVASKAYSVINIIIEKSDVKEKYIEKLLDICDDIDLKFSNTVLQIWHYYVISKNCKQDKIDYLISKLKDTNNNPIILSLLVRTGKGANKQLFTYIKDDYTRISKANNWKKEIMYSKYWLPLFTIRLRDTQDYEHWFNSNNYPDILKKFSLISDDTL